jgi:adenylate cyclase
MGADEEATVAELKAHQAIILPMITNHGGRVIDTAGDGVLAEFSSVLSAVKCAIAMQKTMAERNASVDPARRMQFRIGINQGDVVFDDTRIYGDGVNVAARLEGIAEPGGICISGKVHAEIIGKIDVAIHNLGPQQLKNIASPVCVYRVEQERTSATDINVRSPIALADKPSIAVLPFTNMSGDG